MHRAAKRALAALGAAGEPVLYVGADERIPAAGEWLRRLGFSRAPAMDSDPDYPVWEKRWPIIP